MKLTLAPGKTSTTPRISHYTPGICKNTQKNPKKPVLQTGIDMVQWISVATDCGCWDTGSGATHVSNDTETHGLRLRAGARRFPRDRSRRAGKKPDKSTVCDPPSQATLCEAPSLTPPRASTADPTHPTASLIAHETHGPGARRDSPSHRLSAQQQRHQLTPDLSRHLSFHRTLTRLQTRALGTI